MYEIDVTSMMLLSGLIGSIVIKVSDVVRMCCTMHVYMCTRNIALMGKQTKKNFILKNSLGANLPNDLFVSAHNLELGEPIGQGAF